MLNFDPTLISPFFQYRDSLTVLTQNASTRIVATNLSRVGLLLQAVTNTLVLRPRVAAASGTGINLFATSGPTMIDFATYGSLVGQEWYVWLGPVAANIYVLEIIYSPPGA